MTSVLNHVLCVDDDADILEVVQISLELVGGLTVTGLDSGTRCLAEVVTIQPDLILLDVMMPGMDGPATLMALKAEPELKAIPVIFMTARVQEAEVEQYLALGAVAVIPKPFDPMTLAAQIKTIWAGLDR
ncbi:response regulator [uncultured Brevundimonas sp.]|uniref:response regulator n=1 Tax=uncultured Brevundimonas sp. TaxID=213418 RepID=UPI0030EF8DC6|tara:strand:+ start:13042 stop:13431 length:390 start_codon:yes stop_codon:yes gene_type:complete